MSAPAEPAVEIPLREKNEAGSTPNENETKNLLTKEFEEYVAKLSKDFHVPGVSVAVVDGDKTYSTGYGNARLGPDVKATSDTLYYVGSITKGMTAAALLYLVNESAKSDRPITLDTKVQEILKDDFVLSDDYATKEANLRDVLCHRLGYPRHELSYGGPGFKPRDSVRLLRHLPMSKGFREQFQYSNMSYQVAQHVVETLAGESIGAVYQKAIFGPLGMDSTTIELGQAQAQPDRLAKGYACNAAKGNEMTCQPWCETNLVGPSGVISTVDDFAKYLRAMIHRTLPMSTDLQDALVRPVIPMGFNGPPGSGLSDVLYALGWQVAHYRGHRVVYQLGGVPGFTSLAGYLPDKKFGAIVATNGDFGGMAVSDSALFRLFDDFLGIDPSERRDVTGFWGGFAGGMRFMYMGGKKRLFPTAPEPPLPLSLPLEAYQGTYSHPGYRTITFSVEAPAADLPVSGDVKAVLHGTKETEWGFVLDLDHVSGEEFVAYINMEGRSAMAQGAVAAAFELGADGKVARVGIDLEAFPQPMSAAKIWFDKIA